MAGVWRMVQRRNARGYPIAQERRAFDAGYCAGWDGSEQKPRIIYPNAYSAGYWEGVADSGREITSKTE